MEEGCKFDFPIADVWCPNTFRGATRTAAEKREQELYYAYQSPEDQELILSRIEELTLEIAELRKQGKKTYSYKKPPKENRTDDSDNSKFRGFKV